MLPGSYRVFESFGKLWKLKMPFSRTWKVLEKRGQFKMATEKFWSFVWRNSENTLKWIKLSVVLNSVYVVFVYFGICSAKHNPPKNFEYLRTYYVDGHQHFNMILLDYCS